MRIRSLIKLISALVAFAVVSVCAVYIANHRGVSVTITNNSGNDVANAVLKSSVGSFSNSLLKSGESFSTRVNPTGTADLTIEFTDLNGKRQSQYLNVYFEHNYGGKLDVTIGTNGNITWDADIRL